MSGEEGRSESETNRLVEIRRVKLQKLREAGIEPFAYSYRRSHTSADVRERFADAGHDPSPDKVRIAGRIMSVRDHGKSCFMNLRDRFGTIQIYGKEDVLGASLYSIFRDADAGDILGVEGNVFRTKRGEITVYVTSFTYLSKSLRPLPEKFHGLRDVEARYRMRYLDLAVNEEVQNIFVTRSRIVSEIRRWLDSRGFIEVETPVLTPIPGGALARPFVTHYNFLDQDFYLRIATELYLKRLIVGGLEKVYEIGKDFRNEDIDTTHNPEFTMLELYQAYADYNDMMELTEKMLSDVLLSVKGSHTLTYGRHEVDFSPPWRRITMVDAIREIGKIEADFSDASELMSVARELRLENLSENMSAGELIAELFDQKVQENIIDPTIVYDYPADISPLAKKKRGDPRFAERFEPFACGMEFGNAFSELNNPMEQRQNFERQKARREVGDEEAHPYDEDYIVAMEYGLHPTGGLGIGIDRLCMLFTNTDSIKEVILFPQLRRKSD
ncbi:MAG: lysine--tRNA ligase [Thermoplasmata archaeon]|uniref:Lysine--tRNA ligase n=1 Tax=Candidatus Sysuiplasma superficiale TaxID=2823368 RepID=A0A8J8CC94_9ARCH|nr:lysine--tRNA ligase [Candidatus Sysuiplasma superficiale]MBX8643150.1 lysine--tRNA ligase [Candidatus Sysuiplasma superficiale]MCL4346530.1 lysine--tRNA ligase [Candidatus Thermoplasmatota archaeon]